MTAAASGVAGPPRRRPGHRRLPGLALAALTCAAAIAPAACLGPAPAATRPPAATAPGTGVERRADGAPGSPTPAAGTGVLATPTIWQPFTTIRAADRAAVRRDGEPEPVARSYPRSVGQEVLWLNGHGASATVSGAGRAIYLSLPPAFVSPGPYYGSLAGGRLRYRIDDDAWQTIDVYTSGRDVVLAEDLTAGVHTLRVEWLAGNVALSAFHFAETPLSRISGTIAADDFLELLTDVRADVFLRDSLVHSTYTRNPVNGQWSILGLRPDAYRIRLTAHGWRPRDVDAVITLPDGKVDTGVTVLNVDFDPIEKSWYSYIGFGRTASAAPGESITWNIADYTYLAEAYLVSAYRTVRLDLVAATGALADTAAHGGGATARTGPVTLRVPASTPHDMYALRLVYRAGEIRYPMEIRQAIRVRERLPQRYHVAGVGHMNTWGQQTSEYLAKVAATAELAGARHLLIANEVNALYIAGALQDLRLPYLVTSGNHTMARWDDFFGPRTFAADDGPLRLVALNDRADRSWQDVDDLLGRRVAATARVLVAYEGYAPIELIRRTGVDVLFDGHSAQPHPDEAQFPAGTLHMRAPTQESMRWIAMDPHGLAPSARTAGDVPWFEIPRHGPAPLRVEYSTPNDGSSASVTARVINETDMAFEHARVRLLLRAGTPTVTGAAVLQSFMSDDGRLTIIDVEVAAPPGSTVAIVARSL